MAPTLMGRHKDLVCEKCGCSYQVSASEEVDSEGSRLRNMENGQNVKVAAGTCPMCRYTATDLGDEKKYPSYNGDRILVGKFAYELAEPQRWDVIVFKYPGDAPINFIKRLIGLPGETVRIENGDIWVLNADDKLHGRTAFHIARKPPEKLLAMLQPVFDNDYTPKIAKYGWPARWYSQGNAPAAGPWTSEDDTVFQTDGAAGRENWLRYHHLVPSYQQWQELEGRQPRTPLPMPQLITDFTAYDTGQMEARRNPAPEPDALGTHWVGDLAMECTAEVESATGELIFELCKGGRRFQCRVDVATGRATLSISGQGMEQWRPTAVTNVRGKGQHRIIFSNCDDELLLWVDGKVVSFDAPTSYKDLGNTQPDSSDLAPVGVASAGAQVRISHLRILRDLYYGALSGDGSPRESDKHDVLYQPGNAVPSRLTSLPAQRYVDFPLQADQFFVLGDNSAKSKDGRLWGPDNYWVQPRVADRQGPVSIYWPHSWDKIPYVNVPLPVLSQFWTYGAGKVRWSVTGTYLKTES